MRLLGLNAVYEGWARYLIATIERPDGRTMRREIEDHGSASCVLPYDPVRRTAMLVRQFRAPAFVAGDEIALLEAIAGIIETEEPDEGARREAMEEAGLLLDALEPAGRVWTMPGISTERIHLFLATYAAEDRVAAGGGHASEDEEVEVVEVSLDFLAGAVESGEISDMKTLLLIQTLRLRRPELFVTPPTP